MGITQNLSFCDCCLNGYWSSKKKIALIYYSMIVCTLCLVMIFTRFNNVLVIPNVNTMFTFFFFSSNVVTIFSLHLQGHPGQNGQPGQKGSMVRRVYASFSYSIIGILPSTKEKKNLFTETYRLKFSCWSFVSCDLNVLFNCSNLD